MQPGKVRAFRVSKYWPSKSTWSVVSSLSNSSTNSVSRSTFCRAVRSSPPRMVVSMPPPEPIPQRNRPPEMSSIASTSRVSVSGWRKFGEVTKVPSLILEVARAAAVSVGVVPYHGESCRPPQVRWS